MYFEYMSQTSKILKKNLKYIFTGSGKCVKVSSEVERQIALKFQKVNIL